MKTSAKFISYIDNVTGKTEVIDLTGYLIEAPSVPDGLLNRGTKCA